MGEARDRGVSEEWIKQATLDSPSRHQLFKVGKTPSQQNAEARSLLEGDVIISLDGNIITQPSGLDFLGHDTLEAVIVRKGVEMKILLKIVLVGDLETSRILYFCSAILQCLHNAVR